MNKVELKQILKELGITQVELAGRLHISPVSVSRWVKVPGPVEEYIKLLVKVREAGE